MQACLELKTWSRFRPVRIGLPLPLQCVPSWAYVDIDIYGQVMSRMELHKLETCEPKHLF